LFSCAFLVCQVNSEVTWPVQWLC